MESTTLTSRPLPVTYLKVAGKPRETMLGYSRETTLSIRLGAIGGVNTLIIYARR
jgi:hypothetical protein